MAAETIAWFACGGEREDHQMPPWWPRPMRYRGAFLWLRGRIFNWKRRQAGGWRRSCWNRDRGRAWGYYFGRSWN